MKYPLTINGFEGQSLEVQTSALAGTKLLVNGQPPAKGAKRGEMLLRRTDGTEVTAKWKPVFMGWDTPQLDLGGQVVTVVAPLKWYEWLWSALPVLLVFVGGFIGAVAGVIAVSINTRIFRSPMHGALRYLLTAAVSLITVVVYVVVVAVFLNALGR